MQNCRAEYFLFMCLVLAGCGQALLKHDISSLIENANIYYQKPLRFGEPFELTLDNVAELDQKNQQNIKVIIHGFIGSRTHYSIKSLGNAYMAQGYDKVFLADWADAAAQDYPTARKAVAQAGIYFGKMLHNFFNKHDISPSVVHIIGHSLGAHIAGNIGKYFNGTLGHITGLDPALPLFARLDADALTSNAAQFVDVIHTDYPVFGDFTPRGTVDFYPNYGQTPQPGCNDFDLASIGKLLFDSYSCSHNRAVNLYAESIGTPKNFPALPCSLSDIKQRNIKVCLRNSTPKNLTAEEAIIYMGENVSKSAPAGSYYLATYDAPPFGMGMNAEF